MPEQAERRVAHCCRIPATKRQRPPVSVVVPFRGGVEDAEALFRALARLGLRESDEVIVADNGGGEVARVARSRFVRGFRADREEVLGAGNDADVGVAAFTGTRLRVVAAGGERSSYHARNAGAEASRNEWILFIDADCVPRPDLLDAYFAAPLPLDCGAVAGQILGHPRQRSLAARYARSRRLFDHAGGLIRAADGGAGTGNLLVRRSAFVGLDGFARGIRSGGDLDLCRRLRAAGWRLAFRPGAIVHHRHRESLASLLAAFARYGAGSRWLNGRYPGSSPRWPLLGGLALAAREVAGHAVRGDLASASFRAIDCLGLIAHNLGYIGANSATGTRKRFGRRRL
jgi:GT2 family glycosyltransferase